MSKFWKNVSILALAEILLKAKALIMMPFITKHFGTLNFGIWSQVMVIVSLLSPLIYFGMDNSIVRFLPGQPIQKQKEEFSGWLLFGLFSSLILMLLTIILNSQVSQLFFSEHEYYGQFVILASLNIVITGMFAGIRCWFRLQSNAISLMILTIIQNILQLICFIYILIEQMSIYELVKFSLVFDSLLLVGYIIYLFNQKILVAPSFSWFNRYIRFGIVFLPSGYAIWILNSVDRVFLAQYHDLSSIGIYSIGFTLGYTLIQIVINPIWSLFPPKAAELINNGNIKSLNILFNQSLQLIIWIVLPSIAGFLIVGKDIMQSLATDDFAAGYLIVPIILFGYTCLMLSAYFESILVLKNKPFLSTTFTVIACVLNLILNYMLIPRYSYMGAAIATALSFFLQLTLSMLFAFRENLIHIKIMPFLKILVATFAMYIITKFSQTLTNELITKEVNLLVTIFLGVLLYFCFTKSLRIYDFNPLIKFRSKLENV